MIWEKTSRELESYPVKQTLLGEIGNSGGPGGRKSTRFRISVVAIDDDANDDDDANNDNNANNDDNDDDDSDDNDDDVEKSSK